MKKIEITAKEVGNVVIGGVVLAPGLVFEVADANFDRVVDFLTNEKIDHEVVEPTPEAKELDVEIKEVKEAEKKEADKENK